MEHGGEGFGVSSMLYWFFSAVVHPRHNICDVFIYQAGADKMRWSFVFGVDGAEACDEHTYPACPRCCQVPYR